jgi:hypothetical protein
MQLLLHDLRDAVQFHSADTVQKYFDARLQTTKGEFLVDLKNILTVLSTFEQGDQQLNLQPRQATVIYVTSEAMKTELQEKIDVAAKDTGRKVGSDRSDIDIRIAGRQFRGRNVDLRLKNDQLLGLEYSEVDAVEMPMQSVIRLADNMDIRSNRFSETQREPAFREIYTAFGDNGPESTILQSLEGFSRDVKNGKLDHAVALDRAKATLTTLSDTFPPDIRESFLQGIKDIGTSQDAEVFWKSHIIDKVLEKPEYQDLAQSVRGKIREIGLSQDSVAMRHFGGCEAVNGLELVGSSLTVQVDQSIFDRLNSVRVKERSLDSNGQIWEMEVGVGEYQIWRLQEAFRSIRVGGEAVEVKIRNQHGEFIMQDQMADII